MTISVRWQSGELLNQSIDVVPDVLSLYGKSGSFLRLNRGKTSQILYTLRNVSFLIILDDSGSIS